MGFTYPLTGISSVVRSKSLGPNIATQSPLSGGNIEGEPRTVLKYLKWTDELSWNMFEVESNVLPHFYKMSFIIKIFFI